ncbi:tRNA pseudouridine synthase-like 1 isoform X2 [Bradysia coprophila]|uniref:tRNA pseudouridine synthase-like 1 isoform X2 n=1 Tax=Bradysia coprophila TaxID=38358 RepID=UPI00187D814E|nr:tRNA pseudouridine synthase-like 1 isoform X2 [Bradysia coprophila]
MSYRYLLHIGYIGTNFRGIAKNQVAGNSEIKSSVQGAIEAGLTLLRPLNNPNLVISSRTDAGVHALNSTVHVDLHSRSGNPFTESWITFVLNKCFDRQNQQIRVNKTEIVPDTFHARFSAKRRTYLYRLAVAKRTVASDEKVNSFVPIDEIDRCYFVQDPKFDTNLAHRAAELIKGTHDFRTFMGVTPQNRVHSFRTVRYIESIDIEPGESTGNIYTKSLADETYNYVNIRVTGRSFLNRQVRRIVAVILGVAQKHVTTREVYEMLTIPSKHNWPSRLECAPAHGLYLCQVHYDDKDKEFPVSESNRAIDQIDSESQQCRNELPH